MCLFQIFLTIMQNKQQLLFDYSYWTNGLLAWQWFYNILVWGYKMLQEKTQ